MKRKILTISLLICIVFSLSVIVHADGNFAHVVDAADILSDSEEADLTGRSESLSNKYLVPVYIVTIKDFRDYGMSGTTDMAKELYSTYGLSWGDSGEFLMLILSMSSRDYSLVAHGDFANSAFTDYGKDLLEQEFLDDFRNNDWYGGFSDFLSGADRFMKAAENGDPIDIGSESSGINPLFAVIVVALISAAVAGITVFVMSISMRSVRTAAHADIYRSENLDLRYAEDRLVNSVVTHRTISSERSSGGGGGGTTTDSGGFSSSSGKF